MAAHGQVLDLPELLEGILGALPMRDLFLAQRVCKTWQAVIHLKPLQRKLFFEAFPGGPLKFIHTPRTSPFSNTTVRASSSGYSVLEEYNNKVYHPLGKHLSRVPNLEYMWAVDINENEAEANITVTERRPVAIRENPVLKKLLAQLSTMIRPGCEPVSLPESWQRPEASWRRKLITQPPCVGNSVFMWMIGENLGKFAEWDETEEYKFPGQLGTMTDQLRELWLSNGNKPDVQFKKGAVHDGMRMEIKGRELWEVVRDEGWNKNQQTGADVFLFERLTLDKIQAIL